MRAGHLSAALLLKDWRKASAGRGRSARTPSRGARLRTKTMHEQCALTIYGVFTYILSAFHLQEVKTLRQVRQVAASGDTARGWTRLGVRGRG